MTPAHKAHAVCLAGILPALLAAGCAVGPNFKKPAPPEVSTYTAEPLATTAAAANVMGGGSQRFNPDADIPADWWTLFHSRPLNDLIEQSLSEQPRPEGGTGGADGGAGGRAGAARRLLSEPSRPASPPAASGSRACSRPTPSNNVLQYNLFTPAGQRLLRAGRLRPEPPHRGVAAGAGAGGPLPDDRHLHHPDLQRRGDRHPGGARSARRSTRPARSSTLNSRMLEILRYQLDKGYASGLDLAAQESQLAQVAGARCRRCSSRPRSCATCSRL